MPRRAPPAGVPELVSVRDAADLLDLSTERVRQLEREGKLTACAAVRRGQGWSKLFTLEAVTALQTQRATLQP